MFTYFRTRYATTSVSAKPTRRRRKSSPQPRKPVATTSSCACLKRISIARAILKDAPIILLDEATASLDPENEVEVQKAIDTLIKGRTVIAIAHRLKTIQNADRIIVLDNGEIREEGTHDELIRKEGLYAHLWNIQENSSGWKLANQIENH